MAVTGLKTIPISPGQRGAGFPELDFSKGEASSQTFTMGAPVTLNASGVIAEIASNGTLIYGFAAKAAQNQATDGAVNSAVYKVSPNALFTGAFSVASWDKSLIGTTAALSKVSGSTWMLVTATALSASGQCRILGLSNSSVFATGDSTPEVIFTVINADVQGEV